MSVDKANEEAGVASQGLLCRGCFAVGPMVEGRGGRCLAVGPSRAAYVLPPVTSRPIKPPILVVLGWRSQCLETTPGCSDWVLTSPPAQNIAVN